jgi:hypothetical protein
MAEPQRLPTAPPAQEIRQTSFESAIDRPVPDPEPAELTKTAQALPRPARTVHLTDTAHQPEPADSGPLSPASPADSDAAARPFPDAAPGSSASIPAGPATVTSDRWTEAEIPVRR